MFQPQWTDDDLQVLKGKLNSRNLKAFALSGHCNLLDEKRLGDFIENIRLAGRLGCSWIVSSAGEAHFGEEQGTMDDLLVSNVKRLLPELEKNRQQLVIEVHGEYGTGAQLKSVVDAVGSDMVKINYDTANVVFYGGKLPDEEIKSCADAVGFVHLKDKSGEMNEWNFPAPGKGSLKLDETVKYLESAGFDGPLSVEIEYTEDFTMNPKKPGDIELVNQAVKDAWDFLKSNGYL